MKVVILNCSDTFEHRAVLLRDLFLQSGHQVIGLTSDYLHVQKQKRTSAPENFELIPVRPYQKNISVDRLASHHKFGLDAGKRLGEIKPDLIWAMIPPNSSAKCAAEYKKQNPECKLIFDVIDMWPESLPISKFKNVPPLSLWGNLRNKNIDKADLVVTECALYQQILKKYCDNSKLRTLHLARPVTAFSGKADLPDDHINLCYLGSVNNIIDIPCIGQIIKEIEMPVSLHIIGSGERMDQLVAEAQNAGAQVIQHGPIYDPAQKQAIFDICHFGLNIMRDTVYVGLTMKSLDYFEAGLPIINNIKGDTWDFVAEKQIGINYGQPPLSKAVLQQVLQNRQQVRNFFEETFSLEIFTKKVTEMLEQLNARQ